MKKILIVMVCLLPFAAQAEAIFSTEDKQRIMKLTLQKFWGQAVDSKGHPIMPKDDAERATLPIPKEQAAYIIDKGSESGLAEWCNVSWEERFHLLMKQMRAQKLSEMQIAYIGVLHGVAQGMVNSSMKNQKCDAETKDQIRTVIKDDTAGIKKLLQPS
jgi:hypothetical protein